MSTTALTRIATFRLSTHTKLCIVRGSVVDFSFPSKAAIVNAANPACLGGGGVDGAITRAGGPTLQKHRMALPLISSENNNVRCPTGHAKLTGPGAYGDLHVPYVIHAVGPCYFDYPELEEGDALLQSAYTESLNRAQENKLEAIAFSLLSAGVYRGEQTLRNVLTIGIETICDWIQENSDKHTLTHVFLCGFNPSETNMLVDICEDDLELEFVKEQAMMEEATQYRTTTEEEKKGEDDNAEQEEEEAENAAKEEAEKDETMNDAEDKSNGETNEETDACVDPRILDAENGDQNAPIAAKKKEEDIKMGDQEGEKTSNKRSSDHL